VRTGTMRTYGISLVLLGMLVLAGCQSTGVRDDFGEQHGDIESESRHGPGDIYVKLAVAYMREGRLDVAMQKIKQGIDVEPDNGEAYNVLALLYQQLGENRLAEENFEHALRLQPRNPYIHNAFGSFLCGHDRFDDADEQFRAALANPLYRTPEIALTNAGICARQGNNPSAAEEYFRRALEQQPMFPQALYQMAQVSYDKGDDLAARGYLQRYQAVAKHTPQSLWLGIQTERRLGDKNAVASYEMLLRGNFPDSKEAKLLQETHPQ
jgi:type IV pilus assembly protein PilF